MKSASLTNEKKENACGIIIPYILGTPRATTKAGFSESNNHLSQTLIDIEFNDFIVKYGIYHSLSKLNYAQTNIQSKNMLRE